MAWYQKYSEEPWLSWYQREFTYRFANGLEDPEDACASAIEKLILDRLPNASLKHKENLDAFVKATFRRLALDQRRKFFRRFRAPARLAGLGAPFTEIFFEFCLNKLRADAIAEKLQLPLNTVEDLVNWLIDEKKCPTSTSYISISDAGEEQLSQEMPENQQAILSDASDILQRERHSLICHWLISAEQSDQTNPDITAHLTRRLANLPNPPLDSDDRILLKLLYWEGLSISDAAKTLHQKRYTVRNQRNAILKRLRQFFNEHDIDL